jgi:hypothetical protein
LWVLGAGRFPILRTWFRKRTGVPMIAGALVGVGLLGYLAGLLSFRVKSRWCRECGSTTRCPRCNVSASIL